MSASARGRDQTFTITPDKGYAVANVKIDGKSIGAVKSYTFENVSSPHTIEAIFVQGHCQRQHRRQQQSSIVERPPAGKYLYSGRRRPL